MVVVHMVLAVQYVKVSLQMVQSILTGLSMHRVCVLWNSCAMENFKKLKHNYT